MTFFHVGYLSALSCLSMSPALNFPHWVGQLLGCFAISFWTPHSQLLALMVSLNIQPQSLSPIGDPALIPINYYQLYHRVFKGHAPFLIPSIYSLVNYFLRHTVGRKSKIVFLASTRFLQHHRAQKTLQDGLVQALQLPQHLVLHSIFCFCIYLLSFIA